MRCAVALYAVSGAICAPRECQAQLNHCPHSIVNEVDAHMSLS